jgi:hypothetical protein
MSGLLAAAMPEPIYQLGESNPQLGISKEGDGFVRMLLAQRTETIYTSKKEELVDINPASYGRPPAAVDAASRSGALTPASQSRLIIPISGGCQICSVPAHPHGAA